MNGPPARGERVFSLDRAEATRGARVGWYVTALAGAVVVAGVLVLGSWAMTQK